MNRNQKNDLLMSITENPGFIRTGQLFNGQKYDTLQHTITSTTQGS